MRRIILRLLAWLHWSDKAVCEMSKGMGLADYHDYPDDVQGEPWHFAELTCKRCGKTFTIRLDTRTPFSQS
jgi:hypothetical protein